MKSYRDYIIEKRDQLMVLNPSNRFDTDDDAILVDGLINPSKGEIKGFLNRVSNGTRFILYNDKLLVWDAMKAIHAFVLQGEYRLGAGALNKLASSDRNFAYGFFNKDETGEDDYVVVLEQPAKWVPSLLRKHPKTKHLITRIEKVDANGMPINESLNEETSYRRKGYIHVKTGKMVLFPFAGSGIRPFHTEYVLNNANKFIRGGEEVLLRKFADANGFEPEDEETISMWVDIKTGKVDRDPNLDSIIEAEGWRRVVFDEGISSVEPRDRREGQKLVKMILDKIPWKNIESLHVYDRGHLNYTTDIYSEEDAIQYAKTGRLAQRTSIGRTMAQFREEIDKAEFRAHWKKAPILTTGGGNVKQRNQFWDSYFKHFEDKYGPIPNRIKNAMRQADMKPNPSITHKGKKFSMRTGMDEMDLLYHVLNEDWSEKYKKSIDCNNPKGFSQRAHCQGRKKNEMLKYSEFREGTYAKSGLGKWMNQQSAGGGPGWDRYNEKGERVGKCGDAKEGEAYAACLSRQKADKLGKEKIADFVKRKRAAQRKAGDAKKGGEEKKGQKPTFVKTGVTDLKDEYIMEKNVPNDPALWKRAIAKAKSKFDVYPCVPLDSQAITREGLKSYDELQIGEDILTYNMENDKLEWNEIEHLHFYEQAPLKKIHKKTGFSIRATENHKWVVRSGNDYQNVSLVETKDIHKRMRILTCAELNDVSNMNLFESNWSKTDNWVSKVLSWNKEQREIYLASSIVYDGWDKGGSTKIKDRHTFGFTQKNNDHFWATILSAYLNGYHVSFHDKTESITGATIIRNKKFHSTQNLIIEDDGVEDVWCPTTKNNTWVMVQNGFITITGNSAYANAWAAKWYKGKGGTWRVEEDCGCDCDEIIETVIIHEEDGKEKEVKLNDPFRTPGGPKKFAVYVKNDKGNVVLVRFGDPNLSIKRDQPERLKNFRARHGCDEDPGPKWKAKYWSCKFWEKDSPVSKLLSKGKVS